MGKYFGSDHRDNNSDFGLDIFPRSEMICMVDDNDEDNEWRYSEDEAVALIENIVNALNYITGNKTYELVKYNGEEK